MIHPTAIIDPGAKLGKDVTIGPFTCVEADVQIGDGCVIGPHASILRYTTMGSKCKVHAGAVLGDLPQDLSFSACESRVNIGSNCVIREGVTVHRGTKPGTITEIGNDCFLMAFSHFAHNVKLGRNVIVANGALLAGYVEVGDRAFISGNAVIHQFVRIGRLAMVGGGCGISKEVPPFCTMLPVALNSVAGLNVVGMRRAGIGADERMAIKRAFKTLFLSDLNVSEAIGKIRSGGNLPASVLEFCAFVEASKRGICRFSGRERDVDASE
jgi:UDP-N-acetylglucosamine acyltransferase